MKKHLLFLFAALLPLLASAQTKVEIDGIWYNLTTKAKQAEVTKSGGTEYSGSITIPATITYDDIEYNVVSIGYGAFCGCSGITSITIPEGVTSIGGQAFERCSIQHMTIPEGVTSIKNNTFSDCGSLKSVNIPKSVTSIEFGAFGHCYNLTSITIPESVTSIGHGAFFKCI